MTTTGAHPARDQDRHDAALVSPPRRRTDPWNRPGAAATTVGLLAVVSSAVYFLSDVVETAQGGFSAGQLWLTFAAEATLPFFVVGLAATQRKQLGGAGWLAAVAYAYSYVFFTGTVVYALVNRTEDYEALTEDLGALMVAHGAIMVLAAGLGFGLAVVRRRVFPTWTAIALMAGVVLVALAQGMPEAVQLTAAGLRDLGFAGMGVALLRRARSPAPD